MKRVVYSGTEMDKNVSFDDFEKADLEFIRQCFGGIRKKIGQNCEYLV